MASCGGVDEQGVWKYLWALEVDRNIMTMRVPVTSDTEFQDTGGVY